MKSITKCKPMFLSFYFSSSVKKKKEGEKKKNDNNIGLHFITLLIVSGKRYCREAEGRWRQRIYVGCPEKVHSRLWQEYIFFKIISLNTI